ncbi:putative bifunctional diguanylate cyclase/phosphodiesterase [Neptuniibacter caesariensis]|uniref:C-di-GMP phosphodiesterase A-related protein n=1 Tax=Neptuniibacter caesariensis TaxID=207954 RepID=A0A7U8C738_NEPCE|nr:EAL domain-containing protein [Neptuniibacter caesariensis]EAR61310.1 c-di-GMP phosphodiesterase A-related protein [Oceanospirillum sp. MED92] [Neptuniibacter caesariensis]
MKLQLRHRIAYKQAKAVLVIAILLGLISTGFQVLLDLEEEKKNAVEDIHRVIASHKDTAASAVYNLNHDQARDITKNLLSHPAIIYASLQDDFGDTLAENSRVPHNGNRGAMILGNLLVDINTSIDTKLDVANQQSEKAILRVKLDSQFITNRLSKRTLNSLVFGVLHNVILALILLVLFYRYLSQPILNIVDWINGLRDGGADQPPYKANDELGSLVDSFSKLWLEKKETTDRLNESVLELSRSESFSRSLMENAGDAMFLCKSDTSIVRTNRQAELTLKIDSNKIIGRSLADFSESFTVAELEKRFDELSDDQVSTFEDLQIDSTGSAFPIEARGIKVHLEEQLYILIMARDITARKAAEKQVYELAFFDTLTGMANRRLFMDRLSSSLVLHQTNGKYGAVLYMDLDRFKTINDSLGHGAGDLLLKAISGRINSIIPTGATSARFGGDEFVILLPEAGIDKESCIEAAAHLAEDIIQQFTDPFLVDSHSLYCTISVGIALFPEQNSNSGDILRRADTALYRVKAKSRNGFQFYDPEMQSSAQERLNVEKGLHQAIEHGELELWYQPQIGAKGECIGAEALLRWNHPERGLVFPGDFIQIAEDSGQIVEIGNWVLAQGVSQLKGWMERGLPSTFRRLAVNVSPLQFMQVDFVDRVSTLLDESGIPGFMLELEITENMLLNNFEIASQKMKLLKKKGVSFAIDDFGTGYSSLKYLRHLPLDILKIDRSFVTDLRPHSEQAAIVQVIIATADRLDLVVIAEGVETTEECNTLSQLGCNCFQGYLFSKPVQAETFFSYVTEREQQLKEQVEKTEVVSPDRRGR